MFKKIRKTEKRYMSKAAIRRNETQMARLACRYHLQTLESEGINLLSSNPCYDAILDAAYPFSV